MSKLIKYFRESKEEISKVTWPTKKEATFYSVAIIVICAILAIYIGLIDFGMTKGVEKILEKRSNDQVTDVQSQPIQVSPEDIQVTTEPAQ